MFGINKLMLRVLPALCILEWRVHIFFDGSRPTSAPGREPCMVHRSHRNGPLAREPIQPSARNHRIPCTRPGRSVRTRGPLRNRHDPPCRTPMVAKSCHQVQRSAISAGAAGRDASPRLGRNVHVHSNFERWPALRTIVATRPTGCPWSRKLATWCHVVPFPPSRPGETRRLAVAETRAFAQISGECRCAAPTRGDVSAHQD